MNPIPDVDFDAWYHRAIAHEGRQVVPMLSFLRGAHAFQRTGALHDGTTRTLPWAKLRNLVRLRPGELTVWAGVNNSGKSLLTSQVMVDLARQGERVCIASLEMHGALTLLRAARQATATADLSSEYLNRFGLWSSDGDRMWLYDQIGRISPESMIGVALYCHHELGISHFVIDSLMRCGIAEDDYRKQHWFVDCLASVATSTGMHIHLVTHSRKQGAGHAGPMSKFDVKGSGVITDLSFNVFLLHRFEREEPGEEPDALLVVDKQRNGAWTGKLGLWFHPSGQFVESAARRPCRAMLPELERVALREPGEDDERGEA